MKRGTVATKRKERSDSTGRFVLSEGKCRIYQHLLEVSPEHSFNTNHASHGFPWYSWKEWTYVKELINSENYREAFLRISMWKMTSKCDLPHPVDTTYSFLAVDNSMNERSACLALSMAIVRMIDGFSQLARFGTEENYAVSIGTRMSSMGVPSQLVQARHASAHGEMLSLSKLKYMKGLALKYLFKTYWIPQGNLVKIYEYNILKTLSDGGDFGKLIKASMDESCEILVENVLLKYDPESNNDVYETMKTQQMVVSSMKILQSYIAHGVLTDWEKGLAEKWLDLFKTKKHSLIVTKIHIPNKDFDSSLLLDVKLCHMNIIVERVE
jgi:hypothetical protein